VRGVLVFNVAARGILDAFTSSLMEARDHAMLLNSDGYWLSNPDSSQEWGFMLGRKNTLGAANPVAWKAVSAIPSGQEELADGLWTWSTVYPLKVNDSRSPANIPSWLVVSHYDKDQLATARKEAWRTVGIYALVLLLIYGAIAAWLARAVVGRAAAVAEAAKAHAEAEAANRIRQAQERFRLVVEANTNGLLVADKAGRIVLANPALARMFGYAREELLGQSLDLLLPDTSRSTHGQMVASFMAAPYAKPMGTGRELHGRRKNGDIFPIEISLSPFTESGETYVDAFVADISERKRSENMHRRIEARLQLMMQTNPNGLLVIDDQGAIEMANPAMERMFGYAPGELLNQSVERLVPKTSQEGHIELRQGYMRAPSIRPMGEGRALRGLRKDGSSFPIHVSLASFVEGGRTFVQVTVMEMQQQT
jgi:PAS domain S-box-containing protein